MHGPFIPDSNPIHFDLKGKKISPCFNKIIEKYSTVISLSILFFYVVTEHVYTH